MSQCRAQAAADARRLRHALRGCDSVEAVALVPPASDPTDDWLVDVLLDAEGVPDAVLDELAAAEATLRFAQPQGAFWSALVVV